MDDAAFAAPRFTRIRLRSQRLERLRRFWTETIGLPLTDDSATSIALRAGATTLEFVASDDGPAPVYHFALNVPENLVQQTHDWLIDRAELVPDATTGERIVFFETWNAHALYFRDPDDNIVELIARHTLDNAVDTDRFDADLIECVSEIGLVRRPDDDTPERLRDALGLDFYLGSSFFVGDERGLFILPEQGRPWMPDRIQAAEIFPIDIEMSTPITCGLAPLPYTIGG